MAKTTHQPGWDALVRQSARGLRVDRLFGEWGVPKNSPGGRQELAPRVEARRRAEETGAYEPRLPSGQRCSLFANV